jgi:hypothetical protein
MDDFMQELIDGARLRLESRGGEHLVLADSAEAVDLMVYQLTNLNDLVAIRLERKEVEALICSLQGWLEEEN